MESEPNISAERAAQPDRAKGEFKRTKNRNRRRQNKAPLTSKESPQKQPESRPQATAKPEHKTSHERVAHSEPQTIWVRSDPDHLVQPQARGQSEKTAAHNPPETTPEKSQKPLAAQPTERPADAKPSGHELRTTIAPNHKAEHSDQPDLVVTKLAPQRPVEPAVRVAESHQQVSKQTPPAEAKPKTQTHHRPVAETSHHEPAPPPSLVEKQPQQPETMPQESLAAQPESATSPPNQAPPETSPPSAPYYSAHVAEQTIASTVHDLATSAADYRNFFWDQQDVEPKATNDAHDILPSSPQTSNGKAEAEASETETPAGQSAQPAREQLSPESTQNHEVHTQSSVAPEAGYYHTEAAAGPEDSAAESIPVVDTHMPGSEMVRLAKSIRIDGVSVHEMFIAERLDAEGLHAVVTEYLMGGEVEKVAAEEVIRQELKYERDPKLRKLPIHRGNGAKNTARKAAASVKKQVKQNVNAKQAKRHTKHLGRFLRKQYGAARLLAEAHPEIAQGVYIVAGVVVYFIVLIIIIRA